MFGLKFDDAGIGYWGTRAIFKPSSDFPIDILGDRQSTGGNVDPVFLKWINGRALPELKRIIAEKGVETDSAEVITITEYKYTMQASPQRSYGYLYIGAVESPVTDMGMGNREDDKYFRFLKVGTDIVRWSHVDLPPNVGENITVTTNWGTLNGEVVGYAVESGFLNALTKLDKAPQKWVEQQYGWEVDSLRLSLSNDILVASSLNREVDRVLRKRGLLPKTAGMKKIKATALYWAAGIDLRKEMATV